MTLITYTWGHLDSQFADQRNRASTVSELQVMQQGSFRTVGGRNIASLLQDCELKADEMIQFEIESRPPPHPQISMLTGNISPTQRGSPNERPNIEFGGRGMWS